MHSFALVVYCLRRLQVFFDAEFIVIIGSSRDGSVHVGSRSGGIGLCGGLCGLLGGATCCRIRTCIGSGHRLGNLGFKLVSQFGIVGYNTLGGIATLRQFIAVIAEPRPAFFDDVVLDAEVQNFAGTRNTFAKHNIEFGTTERRRNFVLDHLDDGAFAQIAIAVFDSAAGTDIQTYGSIEFERIAACGGFAGAEHLAYFLTQLVDE